MCCKAVSDSGENLIKRNPFFITYLEIKENNFTVTLSTYSDIKVVN